MKCKKCGHKTNVVRTEQIGENVYRVRICSVCNAVWRTSESNWMTETHVDEASDDPV